MSLAVGAGVGNPDGSMLLLMLAIPLGACVLWGLVVLLHQRRQSRVDLVALEERLQAKRTRAADRAAGRVAGRVAGATERDITASQAVYEQARTSRLMIGRRRDRSSDGDRPAR